MRESKKLKEYVLEGLMIFVAVVLGFIAENIREKMMDDQTELAFMNSMVEDLKIDTSRMRYSISRLETNIAHTDTLFAYYESGKIGKSESKRLSLLALRAGFSVDVVFNDRTSSQLKETGSMRVIDNKSVADSLMMYWNNQIKLEQIHARYEETRQRQRDIGFRTFVWHINYYKGAGGAIDIDVDNRNFIIDHSQLKEFMNATGNLYNVARTQYIRALREQQELAITVMEQIRKTYSL